MDNIYDIAIAEFCGFQKTDLGWFDYEEVLNDGYSNTYDQLFFSRDWEWLMAVVDRIESLELSDGNSVNVTIGSTCYCTIRDSNGDGEMIEIVVDNKGTKRDCVYQAVVNFVEWYNKWKSKQPT